MLAPSVQVTLAVTRSVPSPAFSMVLSPRLSTTKVSSQAAFEGIFAGAAVELVVADVADDVIVQRVADAVEIVVGADAGQRGEEQILDVVRQGEGERDLDGVVSATGIFDDEETA